MRIIAGLISFFIISGFALLQMYAGFVGINYYLGWLGVAAALGFVFLFRFTIPITIGAFFGVTKVWGWHWFWGLLFVAPGLIFVIPGVLSMVLLFLKRSIPRKKNPKEVVIEGQVEKDTN